ncbi:5,10-methylenetetrahydrofolate reductase [Buchnera aphidicola str. Bp (Baizongia pistaciae)]|uniref:5,10-methylenetetrahydrofolate reductase n=1 Tax=Buchnera aphidicola subsp. Baizongia pistaciae (strain Bp) TaxID=224915 RepID=METF_BUCBP|nr:methylenetetrahydrofolate reductase [Buchnera aphidicola]Q89B13.1 RecName: Full=5,10-methylenetetrahydrofolate reductase [Buchnera aphidicola str. Bp (Baizongia pistaciae)]AAO26786.1 5,10-methylenetetrahydrofolate reductase [Buchnera aphidicola str. Bp (Baizongia pistaciae)]
MKLVYKNYHETLNQHLMNICEKVNISFEFFPPNNILSEKNLWQVIDKLKLLTPKFFSVTHGTNSKIRATCTSNIVKKIKKYTGIETVPHLTCINSTEEELKVIAKTYWDSGIRHILALRGDIFNTNCKPKIYAVDLIKLLKSIANFEISVAAYPEVHPEAVNAKYDIINLKRKVEAGATRAITQFFFNIDCFLRFRDLCVKNNITIDIVPGIFPISNFKQLLKFSSVSNVSIPKWLCCMFHGLDNDLNTSRIIGSSIAIDMVKVLYSEGIRSFHFYTLNKSEISFAICKILENKS